MIQDSRARSLILFIFGLPACNIPLVLAVVAAPTAVLVSAITQTGFAVAYTASATAGVTGYVIEVAPVSTGVFASVATPVGTTATISSLTVGTAYVVRVSATSGGSSSPASLSVDVTTATPTVAGTTQYPPPLATVSAAPAAASASAASGAVTLAWTGLFQAVGGYAIASYELQVAYNGAAFTTAYTGAATSFAYTATQNLTAATLTARVRCLAATTNAASAFVALPITVAPLSPPPSSCLNACSGAAQGTCVAGQCRCTAAFLGPDCSVTGGAVTQLSPALTMTSKVAGGSIHFRLATAAPAGAAAWFGIGVGITGGDGMTGGVLTVFVCIALMKFEALSSKLTEFGCLDLIRDLHSLVSPPGDFMLAGTDGSSGGATVWTVKDWYASAQTTPVLDASQDLTSAVVWSPAAGGRVATFSRQLATGDAAQDKPIVAGLMPLSWAIGTGAAVSASFHGATANCGSGSCRGQLQFDFFTGASVVPSTFAPWLFIGIGFGAPALVALVIATALRHAAAPADAKSSSSTAGRWLLHSRALAQVEWLPSELRGLVVGEVLLVAAFGAAIALFFGFAAGVYAAAARPLAFAFGHLNAAMMALTLLPVSRNSVLLPLVGLPFDRAVKYHRFLSVASALSMVRARCFLVAESDSTRHARSLCGSVCLYDLNHIRSHFLRISLCGAFRSCYLALVATRAPDHPRHRHDSSLFDRRAAQRGAERRGLRQCVRRHCAGGVRARLCDGDRTRAPRAVRGVLLYAPVRVCRHSVFVPALAHCVLHGYVQLSPRALLVVL